MSRRRSQSEMAVSLFPFLAVLVCAMGSLILLLLIITRNVHPSYQTRQEDPVEVAETPLLVAGESVSAEQLTLPETGFAPAEIGTARWKSWQPAATKGQTDAPGYDIDLHADATTRMRRQTQFQQQTQRDEKLAMLKNQLLQAQQRREELQQQRQQLQTSMNSSQMSLQQTRQQQMNLAQQLQELQQTAPQLAQEIKRLTTLLEQKKNQQKPVSNEYEIVALDRKSGQVHAPIFVECRKQKIKVQPELLEVDSVQLTDYSPTKNPLAIAILEHWKRGPYAAEQPYVLLIVSPDGIEEFYTMSQLLIANDIHYGYELIDPDQTFFFGTPNQTLSQQMQQDFALALETQPRHQRELAVVEVPTRAGQQSNNYESIMDS
ncbi:MAG: hypothetical protein KDA78_17620, partial [Planctomycetaceae bacterium]|nr:hypothetical protein [Planctomycetaceae bacterium]